MAKRAYTDGRMHILMDRYLATKDWASLCVEFPCLSLLEDCEQDKVHHAEGNVGIHTRMVLEEIINDPDFSNLSVDDKFLMFWTAVFHDSGKPARTKTEADGSITSRGHSKKGSAIARTEMIMAGMPYEMREHMCSLILAHQIPFWLYERPEIEQTKKAIMLSHELNPRLLIMHARADARGRDCADPHDIQLRVELSMEVFSDLRVLDEPYEFANSESKVAYIRRDDRHPSYTAFEDQICEVTVMCGLPGAGKDTWLKENAPDLPVVSLDDLRDEMDVDATDNQGPVVQAALEKARVYLRAKTDFAWNATNITFDMRGKVIDLARDYNARIRIVYLEPMIDVTLKQNNERVATVPVEKIMRYVDKLEPPKSWEAHEVVRFTDRGQHQKSKKPTAKMKL